MRKSWGCRIFHQNVFSLFLECVALQASRYGLSPGNAFCLQIETFRVLGISSLGWISMVEE
jgi:hypothetical protein